MLDYARNGGFEAIENGRFLHINASDGWNGAKTFVESELAYEGGHCLKMTSHDGAFTWIQVSAGELIPGGIYRVSFMTRGLVRNRSNRPGVLGIDVEYYNHSTERKGINFMGLGGIGPFVPGPEWQLCEGTVTVPANIYGINLTIGFQGEGSCVWLDDVRVDQTGWQEPVALRPRPKVSADSEKPAPPKYANLLPDQVFYYSDAKSGTAAVTFLRSEACSADLLLLDGETVLLQKENTTKLEYDLALFKEKKHAYTLRAVIRDSSGAALETREEQIFVCDRPSVCNENGEYVQPDSSVFHPVMAFWQPWPWENVERAAKSGINCVLWNPQPLSPEEQLRQLDYLHSIGVKACVALHWDMQPPAHPVNVERVAACVKHLRHHPAIYCWDLADEPFSTASATRDKTVRQLMIDSYRLVRELDDKYPIAYVEDLAHMYPCADHYADVILVDPYPGTENYAQFNGDMVAKICAGTDRPVISLLQGISFKWVRPHDFEMHSMIYQTFLGGGRSVGYYGFGDSGHLEDSADLWPPIKGFHDSGEYDILLRHYSSGREPNLLSVRDATVWYDVWEDGDVCYAAVQNRTWEDLTVEIPLQNCKTVEPICWKSEIFPGIRVENGGFAVTLTNSQAILLKIK